MYIPKPHDTISKFCCKECRHKSYDLDGKKEKHLITSRMWKANNQERVKLYSTWQHMKKRCYNPNYKEFYLYGGRGITVCDEWLEDFECFYNWAIQNGYKIDLQNNSNRNVLSIDRIDVNKGYSPDNCRWADNITQSRNKRVSSKSRTGVSGVRHYEKGYRVTINVDYIQKHIGCFKNFEDAVIARKNAEALYWGEKC
jgi:hypothetical protein